MNINAILANQFNIKTEYTTNIVNLIDEGATIPFIARYRKELTGSCDDQVLREFFERLTYLRNLAKRQEDVIKSITEQGKLTEAIETQVLNTTTLTEVEDVYRPFKQKRQTKATIAISLGLQPLADFILEQKNTPNELMQFALTFVNEKNSLFSIQDVLQGACDILSETMSDNATVRKILREFMLDTAMIESEIKNKSGSEKYDNYKDFSESVSTIASHKILALNRGEKEDCLKVKIVCDEEICIQKIVNVFLNSEGHFEKLIRNIAEDSFDRLIFPSIEREIRKILKDNANGQAIKTFELNLKPLLLTPPVKNKVILGFDPAFRTGCKLAVIDQSGKVLATDVIYPTMPHNKVEESERKIKHLVQKFGIDIISIGNGTASKESETFIANLIKKLNKKVEYVVVNEAGASVYSASKLGAEEFPDFDVSLRSAVSIARRLQDPLAELVKIDVQSIGVGQYQHDMPQKELKTALLGVVEDCVNSVGVDLNTASPTLLAEVSGISSTVAKNIVEYRESEGEFKSRTELKKVPKLGAKVFEQCAGFLRISNAKNILDNTAVHPESYKATKKLLELFDFNAKDIKNGNVQNLNDLISIKGEEVVANYCEIGIPTLSDIVSELAKPGRDIRDELPKVELRSDLLDIKNLEVGMVLTGTVRNVIDFGAFIDIGVHQDGLVHISRICDKYISHPSQALTVGDIVKVKVLDVDLTKKRISLDMREV